MNIQHEIEGLLSDMSILKSENARLTDRVHSLEVKVGNTNINTLQNRITNYQEDIAKLNNRISALETIIEQYRKNEFSSDYNDFQIRFEKIENEIKELSVVVRANAAGLRIGIRETSEADPK